MGQERDSPPRLSPGVAEVDVPTPKSSAYIEFAKHQNSSADFWKNMFFSEEESLHAFHEKKVSSAYIIHGILSLVTGFILAVNTGESDRFAVRKSAEERFYDLIPIQSFLENVSLVIGSLLAFVIGSPQVSVGLSLFGIIAVLIWFFMGSLQVRVSILQIVALVMGSHVRVKEHAQGQSSSGTAGGKAAGNADEHRNESRDGGGENGRIGRGINEGRHRGIGGGGQRRGNGDDDDNGGREMVGNVENGGGGNPSLEQIANIFLPIIFQSIAIIMGIDEAQLSTTGRVIRYFSTIINLMGFLCCAAVLCQPHTNPRVARILNPRIAGILSRIGSALAVLGFISMMAINIPLHLSWVIGLAFLAVLAIFVLDFS